MLASTSSSPLVLMIGVLQIPTNEKREEGDVGVSKVAAL
eukprot:COSAG01_NODE_3939_length_5514_cov_662.486057_2_plen_39_part_00